MQRRGPVTVVGCGDWRVSAVAEAAGTTAAEMLVCTRRTDGLGVRVTVDANGRKDQPTIRTGPKRFVDYRKRQSKQQRSQTIVKHD